MNIEQKRIIDRDNVILFAREILSEGYTSLDTETTGLLKEKGQACQLGLCESAGPRFLSFVKPTIPIGLEANKIHHITDNDVANAPSIIDLKDKLPFGVNVVIYNAPFDIGILENSFLAQGEWFDHKIYFKKTYDAMVETAPFFGEWNYYRNDYKWQKLEHAYYLCGGNDSTLVAHNALSDAIMTDYIIKHIAKQKLSTE